MLSSGFGCANDVIAQVQQNRIVNNNSLIISCWVVERFKVREIYSLKIQIPGRSSGKIISAVKINKCKNLMTLKVIKGFFTIITLI